MLVSSRSLFPRRASEFVLSILLAGILCLTGFLGGPLGIAMAASSSLPPETNYPGTDSNLTGDDNFDGPYDLGFDFTYYGISYSTFQLTNNGMLCFGGATSDYSETPIPNPAGPNNCIYAFWDDLMAYTTSQPLLYYTVGTAPNRQLIAQWTNYGYWNSDLPMGTFQIILYEGTNNFRMQYRQLLTGDRSLGQSATIGIENADGTAGVQYSFHTASLTPEQSILWTWNGAGSYNYDAGAAYDGVYLYKDNPPPGVTNLVSPTNGGAGVSTSPVFTWEAATGADSYSLLVSTNSNLSAPIISVDNLTELSYAGSGLSVGPNYYWGVQAHSGFGDTWSSIWHFTTAAGNSAPTAISLSNNTLGPGTPANTEVGVLSTTDPDAGNTFTYSLIAGAGSSDNASFAISGSSLRTSAALPGGSYGVRIRSTDQGGLFVDDAFTIVVGSSNQPPTDLALSNSSLSENLPANTEIGLFTSTDPDSGDTFTYSLVSGPGDTDNGSFNISGSNLRATPSFNYEDQDVYSLRVRSTDSGGLSVERSFTIDILNVNEVPTDIAISSHLLSENSPGNSTVGTFSTTDPDDGGTFSYSLVAGIGDTDNSSFNINESSLRATNPFNYEAQNSYSIRVRATDAGGLFIERSFTVDVGDVNEAPVITEGAITSINLDEDANGSMVLHAVDEDSPTLTWDILTQGTKGTASLTGAGTEVQVIYEPVENQNGPDVIIVEISDGILTDTIQIDVMIDPVNDPVVWSDFSIVMDEDALLYTRDLWNDVSDPDDLDASLMFAIYSSTDPSLFSSLAIDPDGHTLVIVPAPDRYGEATVVLAACEPAQPCQEYSLTITIGPLNDSPTAVLLTNTSVDEEQPSGSLVGTLSTMDVDPGQIFSYALSDACGESNNPFFTISGSALQTNGVWDYETDPHSLTVCVQSSDNGVPSLGTTQLFTIGLNDTNDTPSGIDLSNSSVQEEMAAGTVVAQLSTTDEDSSQGYAYTLVEGCGLTANDNSYFNIDAGSLQTAQILDFETGPDAFEICVRSTDDGSPAQHFDQVFTITLLDENDRPTEIILSNQDFEENQPAGTEVGSFSSVDEDAGQTFVYAFSDEPGVCNGADNVTFTLDGDVLKTAASLDYEVDAAVYNICITSTDSGSPEMHIQQSFSIQLLDGNDAPQVANPIPYQITSPDSAYLFAFAEDVFTDQDGDPLTYTAVLQDGSALPAWLAFNGVQRQFSGTPAASDAGTIQIRVTAGDSMGGEVSETFLLSVATPGNLPPVLVRPIADITVNPGVPFTYTIAGDTFIDPDSTLPLVYTASLSGGEELPGWLSFDPGERSFNGTPPAGSSLPLGIAVVAFDTQGGSADDRFTIAFNTSGADLPPTIQQMLVDQNANEGTLFTYAVSANTFFDPEAGDLTYSAASASGDPLPAWLTFNPATRTFTGIPAHTDVGAVLVRVTGVDSAEQAVSDVFLIAISSANGKVTNRVLDPAGSSENGYRTRVIVPVGLVAIDSHTYLSMISENDPMDPPEGYQAFNRFMNLKILSASGSVVAQFGTPVQVCFKVTAEDAYVNRNREFMIGTAPDRGSAWRMLPADLETKSNEVCTETNHFSLFNLFVELIDDHMPETGFAPHRSTVLPAQPASAQYQDFDELSMVIPAIQLDRKIVGVYPTATGWDLTWLGDKIGWLNSTAFPTWAGNSVLTGHVVNANGDPSIFANLHQLKYGDQIAVRLAGKKYIYEVRSVDPNVSPASKDAFDHEELPWLTLITCKNYDPDKQSYQSRVVVRAVLIRIDD